MNLKKLAFSPLILARYGCLSPQTVRLPGRKNEISINPQDQRAYKKLVMDTARGRVSLPARFWHDHVAALRPAACLDIGANYGECMAFGRYAEGTRCIAVEANPILRTHLERTRDQHPDAARIAVESCLLGAEDGTQATLYYNEAWTGGGSAVAETGGSSKASVPTRSADSLLEQYGVPDGAPLVFKMDVEGFEGKVIEGFNKMSQSENVAGILEFDTLMLERAGTDARDLFEKLSQRFSVYLAAKNPPLVPISSWDVLRARFGEGRFHCDLAVFSRPSLIATGWTATDR